MAKAIKIKKGESVEDKDIETYPRNIFEEASQEKKKGSKVLEQAKISEAQKIKDGWRYVTSADGKTSRLTKP